MVDSLTGRAGSLDTSSPDTDIYAIMLMINSWSRPPSVYTLTQRASYVVYKWCVHIF